VISTASYLRMSFESPSCPRASFAKAMDLAIPDGRTGAQRPMARQPARTSFAGLIIKYGFGFCDIAKSESLL